MSFYKPNKDCQIENLSDIYMDLFGTKHDGTFIEIGAYDGETVSNTAFLADLGWAGYYFEPVPEYALRCQLRHVHNKVKIFTCAITDHGEPPPGELYGMQISVGRMVTTGSKEFLDLYKKFDWSKNQHSNDIRKVPCVGINVILRKLSIKTCDLAVIDIEGLEPRILNKWDLNICRPKVIIVESRDKDESFPNEIRVSYSGMLEKLLLSGYRVVQHDGCNVILNSNGPSRNC